MIPFLPLGFAEPLVLLGLASLPVLWWLLRTIPPRPRTIYFPPTRLLFDIAPKEETPARTPWWLTLLRLLLAALVIFAAAGPLWNPPAASSGGGGPLLLMVDDGIAAANTWDARLRAIDDVLARADADHRGVAVAMLSEPTRELSLQPAGALRPRLAQAKPKPHAVDRMEAIPSLSRFLAGTPNAEIVWLSDGTDFGKGGEFAAALGKAAGGRRMTIIEGGVQPARALTGAENSAGALTVKVLRAARDGGASGTVRALDLRGLPLGEANFSFGPADLETEASLALPVEIRNDVARLDIAGERSAGAVTLLDKRWRRRSVGVVTGATADTAQPLLASTYYLSRALAPFADVRLADRVAPAQAVTQFLDQRVPMIILADVGNVVGGVHDRLVQWIDEGGVLVRFAGPRLAASDDDLVPVRLRRGGRVLGGSLSWEQPQQLAAFGNDSPFTGMPVPGDVTVNRQVLAEPDATLSERTWATLADGTPLVTAQKRGKGLVVLFHVTADTRWSNLPLSGSFVDMLKRIVAVAGTVAATEATQTNNDDAREAVPPTRLLDGFGAFAPPPPTARPVPAGYSGRANADHPPGFYGPPEGLLAVNALTPADRLAPLDTSMLNAHRDVFRIAEPRDLRGPILTASFGLLLLDALVVFWLAGGLSRLFRMRRPAITVLACMVLAGATIGGGRAQAQTSDDVAMKATLTTRLAYVVTGDSQVDEISRAGLQSLTLFLAQRTALEAGEPMALDPGRDELAFYPLIYWPVVPTAPVPSAQALERIDNYMKQGGTVLFDTRDAVESLPGSGNGSNTSGMVALRKILGSLDVPELEPIPRDHVLTKTFYLLQSFPGRFNSGTLWVEALPPADGEDAEERPARGGDGVSSILITSNDLAGAWATRPDGQSMLPLVDAEPRQREFAFRAGVNIVMYTLTGNYKADQVHVPALIERLGQ